MDLATIIGLAGAAAMVAIAVLLGGNVLMFLDWPSALLVVGGSVFVVLSKFGMNQFLGAFRVAGLVFVVRPQDPRAMIKRLVELSNVARRGGLLALEDQKIDNRFLADGLKLLIDGHDSDIVKESLIKDRNLAVERHEVGQRIWLSLAEVAPAMGMIGTLIGLVQMMANMDDPKSIGPAMAVALLTTLYGALLANVICMPIADKLKLRGREEGMIKSLVIDGLLAIQAGQNPRVLQTLLDRYLPEGGRPVAG